MWQWAITIKDGKKDVSTMKGYIADAVDAVNVLATVNGLALRVLGTIEGRIEKVSFSNDGDLPAGNPVNADPLSQREEKGSFVFRCDNGKLTHVSVPTFDHESHMKPGSKEIDTALADVDSLVDWLLLPANNFTDSNGSPIAALERAEVLL